MTRSDGPSYLLKQGLGPDREAAIEHKSQVYTFLGAGSPEWDILAYLPHFYQYDPANHLLILELVRDAQTLPASTISSAGFSLPGLPHCWERLWRRYTASMYRNRPGLAPGTVSAVLCPGFYQYTFRA